jgi:hypothetical protein
MDVAAPAYMDVDNLFDSDEEEKISDTSGLKFLH